MSEHENELPVTPDPDPWGTDGESPIPESPPEHEEASVRVPRYLWETVVDEMRRFHELSVRLEEARYQMMQVEELDRGPLDIRPSLSGGEATGDGEEGFRVLTEAKTDLGLLPRRSMAGEDWSMLRAQVEELREEMNRVIDILVKELEGLRERLEGQELERIRQDRARSWWRRLLEPEAAGSD